MKVLIMGGFLGSGKTSALLSLARFLAGLADPERENKVVIVENEIGEIGIDDKYLRQGGFSVSNLFAGCACCTFSGELTVAAARIRDEMNPEWLIVETTGVAYPISMRENLKNALRLDSRIAVLIDASRWRRLLVPMRALFEGQIKDSDAVLINKVDLVDEEILKTVERDILELEPNASIYRVCALSGISDEVWAAAAGVTMEV